MAPISANSKRIRLVPGLSFLLKIGFVLLLLGIINQPVLAQGDTIIYASNRLGQLVKINLTQGTAQIVDTLPFGTEAIEQDPTTGYVYFFQDSLEAPGNQFAYWDPATGTDTIVRTYNPAPASVTTVDERLKRRIRLRGHQTRHNPTISSSAISPRSCYPN